MAYLKYFRFYSHPQQIPGRPRPPEFALVWSAAHHTAEVLSHKTGHSIINRPSYFCKVCCCIQNTKPHLYFQQSIFDQFHKLVQHSKPVDTEIAKLGKYSSAKAAAK